MILRVSEEVFPETAQKMAEELASDPRVKALLILGCDGNGWTRTHLNPWLTALRLPVFGGIFPQILADGRNLEKGCIVAGLFHGVQPLVVTGLSRPGNDFEAILENAAPDPQLSGKTLFVFVDGLSRRIGPFIHALFNTFGLQPNYIGGGAGSLSFTQKPCIITPQGLVADAAILAISEVQSTIGVAHGWFPISPAIKVTEARQNRILSLNWEPAFTAYRRIAETHSGMSFDKTPFFDIAKAYPLGIARLDAEMVVRDPIFTEYGALICVGDIPEGSYVHILHGNTPSLIEGARLARDTALAAYSGEREASALFFMDCISRVLFMAEDFEKEIRVITHPPCTFGALSLGEIANTGDAFLEFYNKTAVAGFLGDPNES
jgi:hypothetical protein